MKTRKRRCKATKKNGWRCPRYALEGLHVCQIHGGLSPQVQAKKK
jgi:hypothetical protein